MSFIEIGKDVETGNTQTGKEYAKRIETIECQNSLKHREIILMYTKEKENAKFLYTYRTMKSIEQCLKTQEQHGHTQFYIEEWKKISASSDQSLTTRAIAFISTNSIDYYLIKKTLRLIKTNILLDFSEKK